MKGLVTEDPTHLKRLVAINRTITASLDVEQALRLIARSGGDLVRAASCLVLLRDSDDCLRIREAQGIPFARVAGFSGPMEESVLDDLRRFLQLSDSSSLSAAPIMADRMLQGVLVVVRDGPLDSEELWLLSALADQAAITLGNARLHQEVRSREARLQEEGVRSRKFVLELETLIKTLAHDLRSPLRSMTGCGELLLQEYGEQFLAGRGREYLDRIAAGARKMDTLIQDLLTYSNLAGGEPLLEPVDLETAVSKALGELKPLTAGPELVRIVPPLLRVHANPDVLVLILRNLLSNALKFVRPGEVPSVTVESERVEEYVRVSVSDAGIGIGEQFLGRIFGIFERLNRAEEFPGTGIGLAIVRIGMERMGGRCGVESKLGEGSRFWVELREA